MARTPKPVDKISKNPNAGKPGYNTTGSKKRIGDGTGNGTGKTGRKPKDGIPPAQKREEVLRLHSEGWSRNEIARELNLAYGTVTLMCQEAGTDFSPKHDTEQLQNARRSQAERRAELRAELAEITLRKAIEQAKRIDEPMQYYFPLQNGDVTVYETEQPAAREAKDLVDMAQKAIAASKLVEDLQGDSAVDAAGAMLDVLFQGMTIFVEQRKAETDKLEESYDALAGEIEDE